jgi:hypothetical protein
MAEKSKQPTDGPEITVRLMGKVGEFARDREVADKRGAEIRMRLPEKTTPRNLIAQIAKENPLLRDQIIRGDGSPRSSTRILLNGKPPESLDVKLEVRDDPISKKRIVIVILGDGTVVVITDIVIIVFVPCDG